jgi:hypothetical protein
VPSPLHIHNHMVRVLLLWRRLSIGWEDTRCGPPERDETPVSFHRPHKTGRGPVTRISKDDGEVRPSR